MPPKTEEMKTRAGRGAGRETCCEVAGTTSSEEAERSGRVGEDTTESHHPLPSPVLSVLAIQPDILWESPPANQRAAAEVIARQAPQPDTLVVLPELFDTGFTLNIDCVAAAETESWATRTAQEHRVQLCVGHGLRGPDGRGRNCATLVDAQGSVLGRYEKVHPFSYGSEAKAYSGGHSLLLAEIGGMVVCPLICYDLRFPELWRLAAMAGAEVFLLGASWPSARQHHWRSLCIARAIENQAYIVAVNRVGRDPTLSYVGGSLIVGPRGEVLAEASDAPDALAATLDPGPLRQWRHDFPALRDIHPELLGAIALVREPQPGTAENRHRTGETQRSTATRQR